MRRVIIPKRHIKPGKTKLKGRPGGMNYGLQNILEEPVCEGCDARCCRGRQVTIERSEPNFREMVKTFGRMKAPLFPLKTRNMEGNDILPEKCDTWAFITTGICDMNDMGVCTIHEIRPNECRIYPLSILSQFDSRLYVTTECPAIDNIHKTGITEIFVSDMVELVEGKLISKLPFLGDALIALLNSKNLLHRKWFVENGEYGPYIDIGLKASTFLIPFKYRG